MQVEPGQGAGAEGLLRAVVPAPTGRKQGQPDGVVSWVGTGLESRTGVYLNGKETRPVDVCICVHMCVYASMCCVYLCLYACVCVVCVYIYVHVCVCSAVCFEQTKISCMKDTHLIH